MANFLMLTWLYALKRSENTLIYVSLVGYRLPLATLS